MNPPAPGTTPPVRPLPIRPRPATGETVASYIRRLARANHLRPAYLRRYLHDPRHRGAIRLDWLAILAGRPPAALGYALTDAGQLPDTPQAPRRQAELASRKAGKQALFAAIRHDAHERGLSLRALADRHGVNRRTVRQALQSPLPPPRKRPPPRTSRLDPFKDAIDDILKADLDSQSPHRRTAQSIFEALDAEHGMTGVSYSTVRTYIADRRGTSRQPARTRNAPPAPASPGRTPTSTSWSPAHQAVEHHDLSRLRDLLDTGHPVEDDDGAGWTLLHHAIDVEHDNHLHTGRPLHADLTAFLLARGADPLHPGPGGRPAVTEAQLRGHWLAAEIMQAWIGTRHRDTP